MHHIDEKKTFAYFFQLGLVVIRYNEADAILVFIGGLFAITRALYVYPSERAYEYKSMSYEP